MMVDFALAAERQEGLSPEQSIYQACLLRFRPIMMTTMAALLGALPLAIGVGTGSELRRPLGIAVVGGLLVSQFLTLYTTPVIYLTFARLERRFRPEAIGSDDAPVGEDRCCRARRHGRRSAARSTRDIAGRRRTQKRELFRAFHPSPGRNDVVDDQHRLARRSRLFQAARSPRCPISSVRRFACVRLAAGRQCRTRSASSLTTPLERQLGLISGLKEMHVDQHLRSFHHYAGVRAR